MCYRAMARHGRTLDCYVKEANLKSYILYDSNPCHSGKSKAMATVRRSVVARSWGESDEEVEHRGFWGQCNLHV